MESGKDISERLISVEEKVRSANRRLDNDEKLTQSVCDMVVEVRHMREDLNEVQSELNEFRSRPGKLVDKMIGAALGAGVTGIITALLTLIMK